MERRERGGEVKDELHILFDSDAFVGWLWPDDKLFIKANQIFEQIKQKQLRIVTTSWVIAEAATVLSHREGQILARSFMKRMRDMRFPTIHIDEVLQSEAEKLFERQEKKGTSMVDCGNIIVMQRYKIPTIFSFDRFYKRQSGIQMPVDAGLV